ALFYERSPWAATTIRSRLDVLAALCPPVGYQPEVQQPPVIVTSALALMQRTLPVREFRAGSRVLKVGAQTEPDKLLRTCLGIGYTAASVVAEPGTFNRRGGIVDVFPVGASRPARIEFFGNDIESLRVFDPATQRSAESIESLVVNPAREALPKFSGGVARRLGDWFAAQPPPDDDITSAAPDEADLASESAFPLLEFYLPYFYSQSANLLDYLPEDALIVVEDWAGLSDCIADLESQAINLRDEKLRTGDIPAEYPLPYFTWDELHEALLH